MNDNSILLEKRQELHFAVEHRIELAALVPVIGLERAKKVIEAGLDQREMTLLSNAFGESKLSEKYNMTLDESSAVLKSYTEGGHVLKKHMKTFRARCADLTHIKFVYTNDEGKDKRMSIPDRLERLKGCDYEVVLNELLVLVDAVKHSKRVVLRLRDLQWRTYGCSIGTDIFGITPGDNTERLLYYDLDVECPHPFNMTDEQKETIDEAFNQLLAAMVEKVTVGGFSDEKAEYTFLYASASQLKKLKAVAVLKELYIQKEEILLMGLTWEDINRKGGKLATKVIQWISLKFTPSAPTGYKIRQLIPVPEGLAMKTFMVEANAVDYVDNGDGTYTYTVEEYRENGELGMKKVTISEFDGQGVWLLPVTDQIRTACGKGLLSAIPDAAVRFNLDGKEIPTPWKNPDGSYKTIKFDSSKHIGLVSLTVFKNLSMYDSLEEFYSAHERYGIDDVRVINECDKETRHDSKDACRQLMMSLFNMNDAQIERLTQNAIWEANFRRTVRGYVATQTGCDSHIIDHERGGIKLGARKHRSPMNQLMENIPELLMDDAYYYSYVDHVHKMVLELYGATIALEGSGYMFVARDPVAFMQVYALGRDINDTNLGYLGPNEVNFTGHGGKRVILNRLPAPDFSWRVCHTVDMPVYRNGCITISVHDVNTEWWQADEDGDKLFFLFCNWLCDLIEQMTKKHHFVPAIFSSLKPPAGEVDPAMIPLDRDERMAWFGKTLFNSKMFDKVGPYTNAATRCWAGFTLETTEEEVQERKRYIDTVYAAVTWSVDAMKRGWMPTAPKAWLTKYGDAMPYDQRFVKATADHPSNDADYWDKKTLNLGESVLDRLYKHVSSKVSYDCDAEIAEFIGIDPNDYADYDVSGLNIAIIDALHRIIPSRNCLNLCRPTALSKNMRECFDQFGNMDFIYEKTVSLYESNAWEERVWKQIEEYPEFAKRLGVVSDDSDTTGTVTFSVVDSLYSIYKKVVNGEPVSAYELAQLVNAENINFVKKCRQDESAFASQKDARTEVFLKMLSEYAPNPRYDDAFLNMQSVIKHLLTELCKVYANGASGNVDEEGNYLKRGREELLRKFILEISAPYLLYWKQQVKDGVITAMEDTEDNDGNPIQEETETEMFVDPEAMDVPEYDEFEDSDV